MSRPKSYRYRRQTEDSGSDQDDEYTRYIDRIRGDHVKKTCLIGMCKLFGEAFTWNQQCMSFLLKT